MFDFDVTVALDDSIKQSSSSKLFHSCGLVYTAILTWLDLSSSSRNHFVVAKEKPRMLFPI